MEVGATSDEIVLAIATKASVNKTTLATAVNITGLGSLNGSTRTLISAPGGVTGTGNNTFANAFALGTTTGNFDGYAVALGSTTTS